MVAEFSHYLGFPADAQAGGVIQSLGPHEGKGDIPVKDGIMDEVDPLPASLAQELLHLVTATSKRGGLGR
jgi:hypothetical protein